MADKIFADGLRVTAKQTQYGEILKLGIKTNDFIDFLAKHTNDKGYCNIDLKKSQSGSWYAELNTYKKESLDSTEESVMSFNELDAEEVPF